MLRMPTEKERQKEEKMMLTLTGLKVYQHHFQESMQHHQEL